MRNVTLRQLKVFETAARHLSFSRAAKELQLSQPAVSAQIRELEGHAGLALFDRLGRRTHLTGAGREMLAQSRAILGQFRDAEEAMARLRGVSAGTLSVAVSNAADYFIPRLLAEFAQRHPGVRLDLAVHDRDGLLRSLDENAADLAIMVRPPTGENLTFAPFASHRYVVVAPPSHPLASTRKIPLTRVLGERFVLREPGSDSATAMSEVLGPRHENLRVALRIASNEAVKEAVGAGFGLGFLSIHAVALECEVGRLVLLDVRDLEVSGHWFVVQRADKRLPPAATAFKMFLTNEGEALIGALSGSLSAPRGHAAPSPSRKRRR
ncbi:MAG TPA: LysR substrate-binding domain-containing protein [Casimicrobiaceae bacterium]|nr:LysR substrate-binding domain-containing protein [Casimicrobiaceae bacterium]